jgi:DNA-binding MarR family transcriptional regulator
MNDNFLFWIGRIRKAVRREFDVRAASLDITAAQVIVLKRLWEGDGILISVLTKDAGSDGGTVTGVLDRLESKALIRRERHEEDRRAVRIWLTDEGHALKAPVMEIIADINKKALSGLDKGQKKQLLETLTQVGENLDA